MSETELDELIGRARDVLDANWRGTSTIPSQILYPHQWSWDSAFISIGLSHIHQDRAQTELRTLFDSQWEDGRVPQITFNPEIPSEAYFPSSDFWQSRDFGGPDRIDTSGLVQPPVHARACLEIYRNAEDRDRALEFLRDIYPRLVAWHRYLFTHRTDDESGLVFVIHPWETGLDNSPLWDEPLGEIRVESDIWSRFTRRDLSHIDHRDRPSNDVYERFIQLALEYRSVHYNDAEYADMRQFAVIDPLFNGILAWSEEALEEIATILGVESSAHRANSDRVRDAMITQLFDEELSVFVSLDIVRGVRARKCTVSGLIPLTLASLPADITEHLLQKTTSVHFHIGDGDVIGVPSYDLDASDFNPRLYWRGPAWVNTSWMVWRGLRQHGRMDQAARLANGLIEHVSRVGFYEYFNPDGSGQHGSSDFSWTAALILDMCVTTKTDATAKA